MFVNRTICDLFHIPKPLHFPHAQPKTFQKSNLLASQNQSLPTKSNNKAYSKTMITILKVKNRDELPRAKQLLANLKPKMKTTSKPYVIVWKVSVLKTISKQEIQLFLHGGRMKCGIVHNTKTGDKNSMNYIKIRYICKYLQRSSIFYYIISILKVKASNFPSIF